LIEGRKAMDTDVLIVGAGASGLVLALCLARRGVRVRIIDRSAAPGSSARAFALQARTLELYDQLGLAVDAIARGQAIAAMTVHLDRDRVVRIPFGDFGSGLSPYPYVLILHQDDHEALLVERLAAIGVEVERNTELVDLEQRHGIVRARLKGPGRADTVCQAAYVCGCDGVSSTVRDLSGVRFPGGSSEELFYVADVEGEGATVDGALHYVLSDAGPFSVFPLGEPGRVRLIGLTPEPVRRDYFQFDFDDIMPQIQRDADLKVRAVTSFSTYRVHQRIASDWRYGRVFLLGEACHVHCPAGGQGLNAGVGDAINLAWKLGAVLKDGADEAVLDTYQTERMSAARGVAATTDRGFALQARRGPVMDRLRSALVALAPTLMRVAPFRRGVFRMISQLAISYRDCGTCAGQAGRVAGGDRMPWVGPAEPSDNFSPRPGTGWQAQVFGPADKGFGETCAAWGLALRTFAWTPGAGRAGLVKGGVYLIRPDGYVAYAAAAQDPKALDRRLREPGSGFTPLEAAAVASVGNGRSDRRGAS
jgi:2-polyprenyl-6-methoxyphenol hydroxylase-like FAD-dependent oxidoreductase